MSSLVKISFQPVYLGYPPKTLIQLSIRPGYQTSAKLQQLRSRKVQYSTGCVCKLSPGQLSENKQYGNEYGGCG